MATTNSNGAKLSNAMINALHYLKCNLPHQNYSRTGYDKPLKTTINALLARGLIMANSEDILIPTEAGLNEIGLNSEIILKNGVTNQVNCLLAMISYLGDFTNHDDNPHLNAALREINAFHNEYLGIIDTREINGCCELASQQSSDNGVAVESSQLKLFHYGIKVFLKDRYVFYSVVATSKNDAYETANAVYRSAERFSCEWENEYIHKQTLENSGYSKLASEIIANKQQSDNGAAVESVQTEQQSDNGENFESCLVCGGSGLGGGFVGSLPANNGAEVESVQEKKARLVVNSNTYLISDLVQRIINDAEGDFEHIKITKEGEINQPEYGSNQYGLIGIEAENWILHKLIFELSSTGDLRLFKFELLNGGNSESCLDCGGSGNQLIAAV